MSSVSAHAVAAQLRQRIPDIGTMKVHKLLYYCQGWHAAHFGDPLFTESVMAWEMGPVVGELWYQERNSDESVESGDGELDEGQLNTIGYVVSHYGSLSGNELQRLTHTEEPWMVANRIRVEQGEPSVKIPFDALCTFFSEVDADEEEERLWPDPASVAAWRSHVNPIPPGNADVDSLDEVRARLHADA